MASRKKYDTIAIDESTREEKEKPRKNKRSGEAGSDTDEELWAFFSGGYTAELGLRSATGAMLERASFQLGPSQGFSGDGWNSAVKFGHPGASGRIEAGRVARAVSNLLGPSPPPKVDKEGKKIPPTTEEKRIAREWHNYFHVLKAYYTRCPHGYYEGLLGAFGEHAGVALVVPKGREFILRWCSDQCVRDLMRNTRAVTMSQQEGLNRLSALNEELDQVVTSKSPARHLRIYHLKKRIDAAAKEPATPDIEAAVRRRWNKPNEQDGLTALRALVKASQAPKDLGHRQGARDTLQGILDEARTLRWAARTAYVGERKKVDDEIRDRPKQQDKAELVRLQELMEYIDPDSD